MIRAATRNILSMFGVTDECVDDIQLALSEACTNVIAHAITDDEYEVEVRVDERRCEIFVHNASDGFDGSGVTGDMPGADSIHGRGVAIMQALMDRVDFASDTEAEAEADRATTIVRLVRTLDLRDDAISAISSAARPPGGASA